MCFEKNNNPCPQDKECKICYFRSFASSKKAEFWSSKNIQKPWQLKKGSSKKFWFICDKSEHEFEVILHDITRIDGKSTWCPYPCCTKNNNGGSKLCNDEDCQICFNASFASSDKAEFWSLDNKLTPREVFKYDNDKYLFKCNKSNHCFESSLNHITSDRWCPYPCCGHKKLCSLDCEVCFNASFSSSDKAEFWSNKNKSNPREVFKNTNIKYLFKCEFDHEFEMRLNHITQRSSWCPYCKIWKNQNECLQIIEQITGEEFKQSRPKFLKTGVRSYLELDGYNKELKLAIEYNGEQHYKYVPFFHRNDKENLIKQQERDQLKQELCNKNNIYLIIVPYWISNKEKFIQEELSKVERKGNQRKKVKSSRATKEHDRC